MSQSDNERQDNAFNSLPQPSPQEGANFAAQPGFNPVPQPDFNANQQPLEHPGFNSGLPAYGEPAQGAPAFDPNALLGPRYQPLDSDLPPRNTANAFKVLPKVVGRLIKKDTANGFAWAFAAKNFGWTIFLLVSALTGVLVAVAALIAQGSPLSDQIDIPVSLPLTLGIGMFVAVLLDNVVMALAVYLTLKWQRVKASFSEAVTIAAASLAFQLFFSMVYVVGVVLSLAIIDAIPVLGVILLVVLSVAYIVTAVWSLVIAYQGQRWFSGSPERFTGKWLLMLIAAIIVSNIAYATVNSFTGFDDTLLQLQNLYVPSEY